MRMKLPALVISLLLLNAALPEAQGEDHLQTLQGEWTVAAAEQRGQPFDAIVGGVLTITGDRFALLTATGNEFQGQIRIDATQSPAHLDFVHDDGVLWEAIYVAQADFFRLNYVEADAGTPRPTMFATTADTPGTVIVLQR
ncbi:MAG: TIGR03067 domain-containing protein [Acidobacteria bacterium]|nr:TIGR03067 domain-containing protein [Acidobacteriota bacterium]MYJ05747.1 TIGR03067 domain-containing protein [Acidobacteriota bacterium]